MSRTPRAVRNGEPVDEKTAAELGPDDIGRIVQHPGHRGYLRGVGRDPEGSIYVCTTTGIGHYRPTDVFLVWGPS